MKEVSLEVSHSRSSFTGLLLLSTIAELIFRSIESPGLLWAPFGVGGNTQYCFLSCASTSYNAEDSVLFAVDSSQIMDGRVMG